MRHLLLLLLIVAAPFASRAQDEVPPDSTKHLTIGGVAGLTFDFGPIPLNDAYVTSTSIGGGVLFNERLLVGAYITAMPSTIERNIVFPGDSLDWRGRFQLVHGGLWLTYDFARDKPWHPFLSLQVGWGQASWKFSESVSGLPRPEDISDPVMLIGGYAGLQTNLVHWVRPGVYVGWRVANGLDLYDTDPGDLNGYVLGISLLFGGTH